MHHLTESLRAGQELSPAELDFAVERLVDTDVPDDAKADFLVALRQKGETAAEIAGLARALLARAVDPMLNPATVPGPLVDVCGTGGDRCDLFNVSTTSMF